VAETMANQTLLHLVPVEASQVALRRRPSDHFHSDIVRAIVRRDVESAQRAIREHYAWSRDRLMDPALGVWQVRLS
jgi:DNA-binding FadR family transcriptional regulator